MTLYIWVVVTHYETKILAKCKVCGDGLAIGSNWYLSYVNKHNYICIKCELKKDYAWRKLNPNGHATQEKNVYIRNPEKFRLRHKQWKKDHPKGWRIIQDRTNHRSELPTDIILGKSFAGCELHHMTPNVAIYVPYEINHLAFHDVRTGKRMDDINLAVMKWCETNIYYKNPFCEEIDLIKVLAQNELEMSGGA